MIEVRPSYNTDKIKLCANNNHNNSNSSSSGNNYDYDYNAVTIAHGAAAGDTPNELLKVCYTCKSHGFPHEAIEFRRINSGRIRNDGTSEYQRYELINYFTGRKHEHRQMEGTT